MVQFSITPWSIGTDASCHSPHLSSLSLSIFLPLSTTLSPRFLYISLISSTTNLKFFVNCSKDKDWLSLCSYLLHLFLLYHLLPLYYDLISSSFCSTSRQNQILYLKIFISNMVLKDFFLYISLSFMSMECFSCAPHALPGAAEASRGQ